MDHDGNLQGVFNYVFTPAWTTKTQVQLAPQGTAGSLQTDVIHQGDGYTADVKCVNPYFDGTGIFVGSLMHSLSQHWAVGVQAAYQHPMPAIHELQYAYGVRYTDKTCTWTTNIAPSGMFQTTYHHKVSDKVELATELNVLSVQGKRDAVCSVGGKWDLRMATFRGQVDTTGRVSAMLEEKLAPGVSLLFTGDIDHLKGQSKFGLGFQMEN